MNRIDSCNFELCSQGTVVNNYQFNGIQGWAGQLCQIHKLPGCHLANAWRSRSKHILQWRYRNEVSVHSINSTVFKDGLGICVKYIVGLPSSECLKKSFEHILQWRFYTAMHSLQTTAKPHGQGYTRLIIGIEHFYHCDHLTHPTIPLDFIPDTTSYCLEHYQFHPI